MKKIWDKLDSVEKAVIIVLAPFGAISILQTISIGPLLPTINSFCFILILGLLCYRFVPPIWNWVLVGFFFLIMSFLCLYGYPYLMEFLPEPVITFLLQHGSSFTLINHFSPYPKEIFDFYNTLEIEAPITPEIVSHGQLMSLIYTYIVFALAQLSIILTSSSILSIFFRVKRNVSKKLIKPKALFVFVPVALIASYFHDKLAANIRFGDESIAAVHAQFAILNLLWLLTFVPFLIFLCRRAVYLFNLGDKS